MLTELRIRDFAIIDEFTVSFHDGLNVISGETGAGKSIVIGAVGLLLGDRASTEMIRSDADQAVVEASFTLDRRAGLRERLEREGYPGGGELVIRRIVAKGGRNRVYINGAMATLSALADLAPALVTVCGQHEHQILLRTESHLDILDEFGGLLPARSSFAARYGELQALRARLRELHTLQTRRAEREDYLRFQLRELDGAAVQEGEDATLQEEKRILSGMQTLMAHTDEAFDALYGRKGSLLEELRRAGEHIRQIRAIDPGLPLREGEWDALYYQLEDWALTLRDYRRRLAFDPERLAAVEERIEVLGRLKRKYGGTLADVVRKRAELADELAGLQSADDEIEWISREVEARDRELQDLARELSQARRAAALRLADETEREIRRLKMGEARFAVRFDDPAAGGPEEGTLHERGMDTVEFYLSPNPGEPLKPLQRIASGGELSRIILAMKKVLAAVGAVGTMVFDEVDAGIGGATAEMVGVMLRDVSRHHQVLCITHLPQIACFADRHFRVVKEVDRGRTTTHMELLGEEEREEEIARMLGGVTMTDKTREHAREMLRAARDDRDGRMAG